MCKPAVIVMCILSGVSVAWVRGATNATPGVAAATNAASPASDSTNTIGIVSMDSLDDTRHLDKGDVISYRVVEDREEPRSLVITELGEIEVPYAGRYAVLNKTCKQLAQDLKIHLEKDLYHKATVIIALDYQNRNRKRDLESPGKITVVGEVRSPGVQVIPPDDVLTVSRAILAAGGFGPYAKKKVQITRVSSANTNETRIIEVDLAEIWEKGMTFKDEKLEPGDLINVRSTLFRFK